MKSVTRMTLAAITLLAVSSVAAAQQPFVARQTTYIVRFASAIDESDAPVLLRQPITLHLRNVTLEHALQEIASRAGAPLSYSRAVVPLDSRVSIDVRDGSVLQAFYEVLSKVDVELWVSTDGHMALVPAIVADGSTKVVGTIAGRVTTAGTGDPVYDATVSVGGTRLRASTGPDGTYSITGVPEGPHTVYVQRIGFSRDSVAVVVATSQTATADFALRALAVSFMDEVVVTGTAGAVSKRVLGNSITTLNAADISEKTTVTTLTELLTAKTPGLNLTPGGGTVGTGASMRIRGAGSVTGGNGPVVYVDGIRVHSGAQGNFSNAFSNNASGQETTGFDMINPDDVESIEVIKGPAAATLYGADAAGGVIQIITKKGQLGQQSLQWNAKVELGKTDWSVNRITNYTECTAARKALDPNQPGGFPGCQGVPDGTILSFTGLDQPGALRSGDLRNYSMGVRGGGDAYSFYVSAERSADQGIWYNNFSNRSSFRSNFAFNPLAQLDFSVNVGYTKSHIRYPLNDNSDAGIIFSVASYSPGQYQAPGSLPGFGFRTPDQSYVWDNQLRGDRFMIGTTLNYRPFSWLRNRLTVGLDDDDRLAEKFIPPGDAGGVFMEPLGYVGQSNPRDTYLTFDYSGTASAHLRPSLISDLSFGVQYNNHQFRQTLADGRDLGSSVTPVVGAAASRNASESFIEQSSLGLYLQNQFGWRDRLYITGAVRMDNNSVFGTDIKRLFYPKASVSYILSDEPFFRVPWVDDLKLRGAWGQAGNAPDPFAANRTYFSSTVVLPGGVTAPALRFGNYGNPDLKPERGDEIELGFEASMLGKRLGIDFTYYNKHMRDALMSVAVAPSTGFTGSRLENLGETKNTGVEIALSGTPIQSRPITWDSRVSLSTNHNELVSFGFDRAPIKFGTSAPIHQFREGFPLGSVWAYGPKRDANGDLVRNSRGGLVVGDTVYLGPPNPTREIGFANTFTLFGPLQVFVLVDYKGGHYTYNRKDSSRCAAERCLEIIGADAETVELMKAPRTLNVLPWVQKADFAKLRDLSISYTVPAAMSQRLGVERARLTLAGHNLAIWKKAYTGPDPEVNYTGLTEFERQDAWTAPMTRRLTTSINLTF